MPRFYLAPSSWDSALLRGDEARHLVQVLRIKPGQQVTVFDGRGRRADAQVLTASRDEVHLSLDEPQLTPPLCPVITLAVAIPKGKTMDTIVQKAVELGVARIQPLLTEHTIVQPGDGKVEKWQRTALEACKQCGQDCLPHLAEPCEIASWLDQQGTESGLQLMASLAPGARPLRDVLREQSQCDRVSWLVGPEGDFSRSETSAAMAAGFIPVTLGSIVLRVETAAMFGLSALRYEFLD